MPEMPSGEPLLRTLAPALRGLEKSLRAWLETKHLFPLSTLTRAALEGLADDLKRQADALQMERPVLVIMLMGGTGVGKSTLLNALAGRPIAQASVARPTTRDPVVYYHESLQPARLDPALQYCKLAVHDRAALEQKIIVDTPDLDSNDLANRERLMRILPVADIVLYVGSQEKYHDKLGWELFLEHRRRRAFAFVLNKWDRCQQPVSSGVRPDEDLLRDLNEQGFDNPLIFRTCAQYWVDGNSERGIRNAEQEEPSSDNSAFRIPNSEFGLPDGEQFQDLVRWLELGLTRMEIEAIKARGVSQLLGQLEEAMQAACPPDLTAAAGRTQKAWAKTLGDEAQANVEVLLGTLEPYQREIEHHFALERQKKFRGLMGTYLYWFNRLKYAGSSLKDRIPFLPRVSSAAPAAEWDLSEFTRACTQAASERHLDARGRALTNHLLVEAEKEGFPLNLLNDATETAGKIDWRARHAHALIDVLAKVETELSAPTGTRRWVERGLVFVAEWVPILAFGGMATILLWQYTVPDTRRTFAWGDLLLPVVAVFLLLIVMHVVIVILLPLRWHAIRAEFERRLKRRLLADLEEAFARLPAALAQELLKERQRIDDYIGEIRKVASWLSQREEVAGVKGLYGKT